jgi:hypothetical protein
MEMRNTDIVEVEKFVLNKIRMIGDGSREFACLPIYA